MICRFDFINGAIIPFLDVERIATDARKHARIRYAVNGMEYVLIYDSRRDEIRLHVIEHRFFNGSLNFFRDDWVSVHDIDVFRASMIMHRPTINGSPELTAKEILRIRQFEMIADVKLRLVPIEHSNLNGFSGKPTSERTLFIPGTLLTALPQFGIADTIDRLIRDTITTESVGRYESSITDMISRLHNDNIRERGWHSDNSFLPWHSDNSFLPPILEATSLDTTWPLTESDAEEESDDTSEYEKDEFTVVRKDVDVDDVIERIDSHLEENEIDPLPTIHGAMTQHYMNQFEGMQISDTEIEFEQEEQDDYFSTNIPDFIGNEASRLPSRHIEVGSPLALEFERLVSIPMDTLSENGSTMYQVVAQTSTCLYVIGDRMECLDAANTLKRYIFRLIDRRALCVVEMPQEPRAGNDRRWWEYNRCWLIKDRTYIPIDWENDDTSENQLNIVVSREIFELVFEGYEKQDRYDPTLPICSHNDFEEKQMRMMEGYVTKNKCRICGIVSVEDVGLGRTFVDFDAYARWKTDTTELLGFQREHTVYW